MGASVPDRGPELRAINVAFMAAAVVANVLRCYVRIRMVKAFGVDDWLMMFATLAFIAYCSSSTIGVHYGTGRHHVDLSEDGIQKATHCWWFCYLFYCCTMISSKVSIGCFLLRIAVGKIYTWIIYAAMLISIVAGTVFFFVTLFQCHPISFFWNKTQDGTCINVEVIIGLAYLYSTFSIISDFTFAILPAFLIMNLQLKRRTKIALVPLLAMGCIASSAVVARVPYLPKFRSTDFLWDTLDIAIWSTVEQGLAITAGSLATLRPLFSIFLISIGLTTKTRPSNYAAPSPFSSQGIGGPRSAQQTELSVYKASAVVDEERVIEEERRERAPGSNPRSPSWYPGGLARGKGGKKGSSDDGSERSLRHKSDKSDSASVNEEGGMQIMVSRSFFVTDSERTSFVEREPR